MNSYRKRPKWRLILPIVLLAVVCVVVAELMVCRVADPALYQKITAPVLDGMAAIRDAVIQTAEDVSGQLAASRVEAEPPDDQMAGEPALAAGAPVADPALTRLAVRPDGDWLTGGSIEVRYFRQSAPEWADKPYGKDNVGAYGCGPTAMAMAVVSLTGADTDPARMANWAYQEGYCARGRGSYLSLIEGAGAAYGLAVTPMTDPTTADLLRELATGKIAVALVTKGHFTSGGHFILLRGATLDGKVLIADPNSQERSLTTWDPQLILDELSPSRNNGAPLWLLSAAGDSLA